MSKKRTTIIVVCLVALVMTVTIGATLAYFTSQDQKINKFTGAGNDDKGGTEIEVVEPSWDPNNGKDIFPGDTIPKDPTAVNLRDDSFVRLFVEVYEQDDSNVNGTATRPAGCGAKITDPARLSKIQSMIFYKSTAGNPGPLSIAALAAYPRYNSDNYVLDTTRSVNGTLVYNYKGIMPKSTTADVAKRVLFTHVAAPTEWNQDDIKYVGNFNIVVTGQAIQAKNLTFDTAWAALDAQLILDATKTPAPSASTTP